MCARRSVQDADVPGAAAPAVLCCSALHGSLTATARPTLAGAHTTDERYVQTPKAKWTYLRVAAGTGRTRYLNEVPGGAARAGGAASPRGSAAARLAPRARTSPAPLS